MSGLRACVWYLPVVVHELRAPPHIQAIQNEHAGPCRRIPSPWCRRHAASQGDRHRRHASRAQKTFEVGIVIWSSTSRRYAIKKPGNARRHGTTGCRLFRWRDLARGISGRTARERGPRGCKVAKGHDITACHLRVTISITGARIFKYECHI